MAPYRSRLRRRCAGKALSILLAAAALACGCASPDEPESRHPIVPQPVADAQARQQGTAVVLSFTLPRQSTRKEPLAMMPAVEIYRGEEGAGGTPVDKIKTRLVYTIPSEMLDSYRAEGKIVYRDEIEAAEFARASSGAGAEWVYLIRTRAARNRASAGSNRVVVHIRPAPEAVSNVTAKVTGRSVTVSWARETNAAYRLYRAEIAPESVAAVAAASGDESKAALRTPLVQVAQEIAPAGGAGGYLDRNVELGHSYLYIVRRVAQFGGDTVESVDSRAAAITVVEAVPPAAPQEVQVVVVAAAAGEPASVSLSWAIGSPANVAGYAVYRSEQEGVRGVRLNQDLIGAPAYRDGSVTAGRRYFYSVTAVDGAGLESTASQTVEAQVPAAEP